VVGPTTFLRGLWHEWRWWLLAAAITITAVTASLALRRKGTKETQGTLSIAPTVAPVTTKQELPRIHHYINDFTAIYGSALVYVNQDGSPAFNFHNIRFERPDVARQEGAVHTLIGGVKPKTVTWVDYPTSEDLMFRFPLSDRETVSHLTTGALVAKTDNFKYVFRRNARGHVEVLDSVTYDKPVKETWYTLAKLSTR
jgi:hypothetical protein